MEIYTQNRSLFTTVCGGKFGRDIVYTNAKVINADNIADELSKALSVHNHNATEIDYLDRYYRGDQPILYRHKTGNRDDVNNKIVVNLAYELVERRVAETFAEPIQYVLRGVDDKKAEEISWLNQILDSEDRQECDIEIGRWRSICGTAYKFVDNDNQEGTLLDESDFSLYCEDPRKTFIAYSPRMVPMFSCQIEKTEKGETSYFCYTRNQFFRVMDGEVVDSGLNANFGIPVIEYPNNSRRLSDIELLITVMDSLNTLSSDRINGVEQFVSSWLKFVNCEIDVEQFQKMRESGALIVKSNNGSENKADVDLLTNELNQTESQVVFNDLYDKYLEIAGLANRSNQNSGGDTGNAVSLRNGHFDSGLRTAINEPIIKKAENAALRIMLNRLRIKRGFTLLPSDVEIHINHNKMDNLMTKAEALKILLESGIHFKRAIKTVDLFSDSERVAEESTDRMNYLYPTEDKETDTETVIVENEAQTADETQGQEQE